MKPTPENSIFGKKLLQLRRERGLSQPDLGKLIGTSGTIIGRYERSEITPSIEVARKLAKVLEVTVDSLVFDQDMPDLLHDRQMLERLSELQDIPSEDRDKILYLVDGLIRDAKARQTYREVS